MKIAAVTSCPTGIAHTLMAAEALKKAAAHAGHQIKVETQSSIGAKDPLTPEEIAAADVVILATDVRVDDARFAGKPVYETRTADAIRHTAAVLDAAAALVPGHGQPSAMPAPEIPPATAAPNAVQIGAPSKRLVAVTACPTGIAHTFMAAEA